MPSLFRRKRATTRPDPTGPTHGRAEFPCEFTPQDVLTVRAFRGTSPGVEVGARDGDTGDVVVVIYSRARARALAAALLNAADNAEGQEPEAPLAVTT